MRTKTIATLGPASANYETMMKMVHYGVRIFRLNFSHSNADDFKPVVELIRRVEYDSDTPLTAMGDLCGPKTRVGEIEDSPLQVAQGDECWLGLPVMQDKAKGTFIPLDFPELLIGLEVGMPVSLADGMLQFEVIRIVEQDKLYELKAKNANMLTSNKGVTFPGKFHPLPAMTDKDRMDVKGGMEIGMDAFALSFVQTAQDILDLKEEIAKYGRWVPVVAKLERQNAVDNLDKILEVADAVMVARGDLGLECTLQSMPVIQKRIIRAARHAQKACIVATQMLLSMVKNPVPTRAETTDVANAILDGADCVMLSEETAIGENPVECVKFIQQVSNEAEEYFLERVRGPYMPAPKSSPDKYMAYCATLMADQAEAEAIVSHSMSGRTARLLSSRRPARPIYCVTGRPEIVRYMSFFWGVRAHLSNMETGTHMQRVERYVAENDEFTVGKSVVMTSGEALTGSEGIHTNQLKIYSKNVCYLL